jgi:predicted branched-subunit amino acid permease
MKTRSLKDFFMGVRQELPLAISALPFGLILGASLKSWNISFWLGISSSFVIFAGASQFLTLQMMALQAPIAAVIFAALATNLRHIFYTLKLMPYLKTLPLSQKIISCYLLTDECFAAVHEIEKKKPLNFQIYLGAGFTLWLLWNVSTLVGYFIGNVLPASLHLDKSIDFLFLAILTMQIQNRTTFLGALIAACTSILTSFLPYKINIIIGLLVGFIAQRLFMKGESHDQ